MNNPYLYKKLKKNNKNHGFLLKKSLGNDQIMVFEQ
jgi:hypothetical protein